MASSSPKLVLFMARPLLVLLFLSSAHVMEAAAVRNGSSANENESTPAMYNASSLNIPNDGSAAAALRGRSLASTRRVFSLDSYGAHGDGKHDDTQALAKAWNAACSSSLPAVLLVPKGKSYLLKFLTLSGPCKSSIVFMVKGALVASPNRSDWSEKNRRHWIVLRAVSGLTVNGGGTINGNGESWWRNSCKINRALPCNGAPTALTFHFCTNLRVEDLKVVNSQQIHMSVEDCAGVRLARLSITAPGTSPNTDGIHVARSKGVQVTDCTIKTGDDCMSIENGTRDLHATRLVCGPGHGISIGSLGDDNSRAEVSGIYIDRVQLYGTTNGARIKTWQGGSGYAKDIIFQNMIMDNVKNPIIIDQNYCDSAKPCKTHVGKTLAISGSAVEVSNVVFKNIRGTTISRDAIKLNCSKNVPCYDIVLQNINLKMEGGKGGTESTCQNARWRKSGTVVPQPCTAKN